MADIPAVVYILIASIFTYMNGWFFGQMKVNIPYTWILVDILSEPTKPSGKKKVCK